MSGILIVGGGVAGAAAAIELARAGREVTLVEREAAPRHKICGEFLSIEAQTYLRQLGLDAAALGGHDITHLRLARGHQQMVLELPFTGLGLTRRALDGALLARAQAAGATILRGQAVRSIAGGVVDAGGHGLFQPEALLLATGKHEARGVGRAARPSPYIGFKTYLALAPEPARQLARHVELTLFPGGYCGLQYVEGGQANLCVLAEKKLLARHGGHWAGLLAYLETLPHLGARLAGAKALLAAPLAIAGMPYGFIHRGPGPEYRLGDQAAVIHSFTGDGMALALHSAALAAGMVLRGQNAASYHALLARQLRGQIFAANLLHGMMTAKLLGPALFALAGRLPRLLQDAARLTRVPPRARLHPS